MRVVLAGSSGRIGRAIFGSLAGMHEVVGIDRNVFSTTHIIGDCADPELLKRALDGADAVIHAAGPHAPHVGVVSDAEFFRVNVDGTRTLAEIARTSGVRRLLYTSTTALYGDAVEPGQCSWIDEDTVPRPRSVYHRTKLAAERLLEDLACAPNAHPGAAHVTLFSRTCTIDGRLPPASRGGRARCGGGTRARSRICQALISAGRITREGLIAPLNQYSHINRLDRSPILHHSPVISLG